MAARRPQHTPTAAVPSSFADLGLPAALTRALAAAGITEPRPIQAATLPDTLAGRDVLARGRTGSGKTYAFVLPLLTRLPLASLRTVRRILRVSPHSLRTSLIRIRTSLIGIRAGLVAIRTGLPVLGARLPGRCLSPGAIGLPVSRLLIS